jgi:hypothetical protein
MASSPPGSPSGGPQRPMSAMFRPHRSSSRMSVSSKFGGGSRASDEDGKTSVKVGSYKSSLVTRPRGGKKKNFKKIKKGFIFQVKSETSR